MKKRKPADRTLPNVLKELLEVEFRASEQGTQTNGTFKRQFVTREFFEDNGREFELRVIRIVKPEGITMAEYQKSGAQVIDVDPEDAILDADPLIPSTGKAPTAADLGVDVLVGENNEVAEPSMYTAGELDELDYAGLKREATARGIEFKGNISKQKLRDLLI